MFNILWASLTIIGWTVAISLTLLTTISLINLAKPCHHRKPTRHETSSEDSEQSA